MAIKLSFQLEPGSLNPDERVLRTSPCFATNLPRINLTVSVIEAHTLLLVTGGNLSLESHLEAAEHDCQGLTLSQRSKCHHDVE